MLFPTVHFALFFTVVLGLSWLLRPRQVVWRVFIISASFFFYGYWDTRFVFLLAAVVVVNHAVARAIAAARATTAEVLDERARDAVGVTASRQDALPLDGVFVGEVLSGHRTTPPGRPRSLLALGLAFNLGTLAWFKYYGFFTTSFANAMRRLDLHVNPPLIEVLLPIGISFFTFQAISYLVDIARGRIQPMPFLDFALYLTFFPHLLSGPIVRASEFAPQLSRGPGPRSERRQVEGQASSLDGLGDTTEASSPASSSSIIMADAIPSADAFLLILGGLVKKVLVATYLAEHIVDPVFGSPNQHGGLEVLFAVYAFAVVIFADFSGYTDIATGCALLLGFRFPRNFHSPYASLSMQDFWRRWHMTLCRWLRDYVYIPLGGSRGGRILTARNLIVTFLLSGLWHGAAWHFVVWAAVLGAWLVIERSLFPAKPDEPRSQALGRDFPVSPARFARVVAVFRWLVTFHVVCLGWIFFRADSLERALSVLERLPRGWGSAPLATLPVVLITFGALATQWLPARLTRGVRDAFAALPALAQAVVLAAALVLIEAVGPQGVPPFIYFRF